MTFQEYLMNVLGRNPSQGYAPIQPQPVQGISPSQQAQLFGPRGDNQSPNLAYPMYAGGMAAANRMPPTPYYNMSQPIQNMNTGIGPSRPMPPNAPIVGRAIPRDPSRRG